MLGPPRRVSVSLVGGTAAIASALAAGACAHGGEVGSSSSGANPGSGASPASGASPGDLLGGGLGGGGIPLDCDGGRCTCVNIASIGKPAHYGDTAAFTDWLNSKSTAAVDMFPAHPTLTGAFLSQYDVLIVQWLTDSNSGPYWTFTDAEIEALKEWVNGGGGLVTLSGYDSNSQEVVPLNRLLSFTDISYNTDDVLAACPAAVANRCYCWGNSVPLGPWAPGPIGKNITQVGAFHGRSINPGSASVDCSDASHTYAAHETVGKGRVFAFTDEWVTYTSQWLGASSVNTSAMYTDPNNACYQHSAANVFQVPQFWFNVISWEAQSKCVFTIRDPSVVQ